MPALPTVLVAGATMVAPAPNTAAIALNAVTTSSASIVAQDAEPKIPENTIIITARRREESCAGRADRDLGDRRRDDRRHGRFNVYRLQQLTPTLQFYSSNPRNSAVNIRGLGAPFGLTNDGIEQGVGIYVDDVYYSRAAVRDVRLPRRRAGRGAARAAGHALRQEHHRRRDQHHAPTSRASTPKAAPNSASAISISCRPRRRSRARSSDTRRGARSPCSGTTPPRHDLQCHHGRLDQRRRTISALRGQMLFRPQRDLDVTLSGDYSAQNPECCGTVLRRATAPTQRAAQPPVSGARRGARLCPGQHRSVRPR